MDGYTGQENIPMAQPGVRPLVDPEALGEVDPSRYPQPKDATHKIRGRSDIIEMLCGTVDQELLTVKTFYFFFYAAFGSLFPLMGVYFKQMGMNPAQCGLLIGSRPFVEFLAAPFWGSLADRWQKGKMLLLASLSCWIIFTLPLSFIQPPPSQCLVKVNVTTYELRNPDTPKIIKREAPKWEDLDNFGKNHESTLNLDSNEENNEVFLRKTRAASHTNFFAGQSPLRIPFIKDYNEKLQKNLVKPVFSSIVYTTQVRVYSLI